MTSETAPAPGTPVTVPMADAQAAGTIVAAPVAPAKGVVTSQAAVVAVIPWQQSKTVLLAIAGFVEGIVRLLVDVAEPIVMDYLLSGKPLDWENISRAAVRPLLTAVASALFARWKIRDNRIVGKPEASLGSSPEIQLPQKPLPRSSTEDRP